MNSRLNRVADWEGLAQANHYSSSCIARECGVTVRQLERFFFERYGTSPHKWLREMRMHHAITCLITNFSVKETAGKLAYRDVAHFTHDFKEFFGITPSHCDPQSISIGIMRLKEQRWPIKSIDLATKTSLLFFGFVESFFSDGLGELLIM